MAKPPPFRATFQTEMRYPCLVPNQKVCTIPDCGRPIAARNWCNTHWKRWSKQPARGPFDIGGPLEIGPAEIAVQVCQSQDVNYRQSRSFGQSDAVATHDRAILTAQTILGGPDGVTAEKLVTASAKVCTED